MPTRFLSAAELERLQRFPESIAPEDLAAHFALTAEDLAFVRGRRGAPSRLGVALQLCALRLLGFVPADLVDAPAEALDYLAAQLDVPARAVFDYGMRGQTRRGHHVAVRDHLGFRHGDAAALERLAAWLAERAHEHDRPTRLFGLACEQLRARGRDRPVELRDGARHRLLRLRLPALLPRRRGVEGPDSRGRHRALTRLADTRTSPGPRLGKPRKKRKK